MEPTFLDYFRSPDSTFNLVDLVVLVFVLLGGIRGLFRGFAEEMAGLVGTALVFLAGWKFYAPASKFIREHTRLDDPFLSDVFAYAVMIVGFMAAWNLLVLVLKKALGLTFGQNLKRIGGFVLGAMKCLLVSCMILMAVGLSDHGFLKQKMIEESWFGSTTQQWLPETLAERFPTLFPEKDDATGDEQPASDPEQTGGTADGS